MECNEVFSVSRSALLGQHLRSRRSAPNNSPSMDPDAKDRVRATGASASGFNDVIMWSSSPVDSLRTSAAVADKHGVKPSLQPVRLNRKPLPTPQEQRQSYQAMTATASGGADGKGAETPAVLQVTDIQTTDANAPATRRFQALVVNGVDEDGYNNIAAIAATSASVSIVDEDSAAAADGNRMNLTGAGGSPGRARRWLQLCHCSRELFAIKLFYFAFLGSLGVVLTYLAVFLKQHGLSAFEIGVISGIRPVIGFLSAPAWGAVADHYKIRRVLMLVSMIAWLAFFVGLYTVGDPTRRPECPESLNPFLQRVNKINRRSIDDIVNSSSSSSSFDKLDTTTMPSRITATTTTTGIVSTSIDFGSLTDMPSANETYSAAGTNTTVWPLLSASDQARLRENLDWLYEESSRYRVFIICLIIICGGELFQAPTTAMSDAATLQILGRDRLDQYGAQRAWGPVGWAISSLITGSVLDAIHWKESPCGVDLSFTDYRIIACIFIPSFVLGLIAALKINFGKSAKPSGDKHVDEGGCGGSDAATAVEPPSQQHSTLAVIKVFLNVRNGSWILTTFYVGVCNGLIWGFLFWHLDNLGGSKLLMGIDAVVVCLFEFGAFFIVDYVIKLIGHMGVMYVGLLGYAIRFVVYASITNPWTVLPVEVLQGVTFSFIWVSLSQYTAIAVPSVSLGTVQGIIHGVYFGLGNGVGHFVGGVVIGQFGAVVTFYAFAVATTVWLIIFFICQKFSKKPLDPFAYQDMNASGDDATSQSGSNSRH